MKVKAEKISVVASMIIFALIAMIGFASEVPIYATFLRAAGAAVVIGLLIYFWARYIDQHLIPSLKKAAHQEAVKGSLIDFNAGQDEDISALLNNSTTDSNNSATDEQFQPFNPQQIDPNLEKVLKENPQQAAEVVRKMGFDQ